MKLTAFVAAALLATTASAQEAAKPTWTFALHGFVSMTTGYQTNAFAAGAGAVTGGQTLSAGNLIGVPDRGSWTADVRQSRFNFSVKGSETFLGATPTAVLEIDFFGGDGAGAYGKASVLPRLRTTYSELNWGAHRLQLGQQNDLTFAQAPTSLSHIGFPLGFLTGNVGWRRPGVFGFHTFPTGPVKLELAWEVGRANWNDGAPPNNGLTAGEASGGPAVQGRVTVSYGSLLTAWAATHYNRSDLNGLGTGAAPQTVKTQAYVGGFKAVIPVEPITLTLAGCGFTGTNVGPLVGNFLNFNVGPNGHVDVDTTGYWGQLGVNVTKEFSLWGLYGGQESSKSGVTYSGGLPRAYKNATTNAIAMYRQGGYALSAEWINFKTTYALAGTAPNITAKRDTYANQVLLTGNYYF